MRICYSFTTRRGIKRIPKQKNKKGWKSPIKGAMKRSGSMFDRTPQNKHCFYSDDATIKINFPTGATTPRGH